MACFVDLYTAAFIAEIVRAGILAVAKGQTEASYSLGLRPGYNFSPDYHSSGFAGDYSAPDLTVFESDEKLIPWRSQSLIQSWCRFLPEPR